MGNTESTILLSDPPGPAATGNEFREHLAKFASHEGAPYVHPTTVSFRDGRERNRWRRSALDGEQDYRATIRDFWDADKGDRCTWVGFFSIPRTNPSIPWYYYAIAVIATPDDQGKHLVFWDCDPSNTVTGDERITEALIGLQRAFWRLARNLYGQVTVWYYTGVKQTDEDNAEGMGFAHTIRAVQRWVEAGDRVFEGTDDPRIQDCVRLTRV